MFGLVPSGVRAAGGQAAVRRWSTLGLVAVYGLGLMVFLHTMVHLQHRFYSPVNVPLPVPRAVLGVPELRVAFWGYFRAHSPTRSGKR